MYIKRIVFLICLMLSLLVGFAFSAILQMEGSQSSLLSGDISKASRYNNVREDPEIAVMVEKLQKDTAFFNRTRQSVDILMERVCSIASLSEETVRLCSDIPELNTNVTVMNSLSAKAFNTGAAFKEISGELERIASGKEAPRYEQAFNNAFVGLQKISNQMEIGKTFMESVEKYLSDRNPDENKDLVAASDAWSLYCSDYDDMMADMENDAVLNAAMQNFLVAGANNMQMFVVDGQPGFFPTKIDFDARIMPSIPDKVKP